jgi:hypothetical protein
VSSPRLRPGSTLGLGLGAFLVSFLPLSLLPMKPNITRTACQSEVVLMQKENKCLKFNRDQILNMYWELANLNPDQTKGNITGQLKALDSLCEQLAVEEKPITPAKRAIAHEIYRSGWMLES